jgi:hypothetical protein
MGSTAACPQWSQTSDVPKPINVTKKCVKQDNGEWIISLTWQYPEGMMIHQDGQHISSNRKYTCFN